MSCVGNKNDDLSRNFRVLLDFLNLINNCKLRNALFPEKHLLQAMIPPMLR